MGKFDLISGTGCSAFAEHDDLRVAHPLKKRISGQILRMMSSIAEQDR